MATVVRQIMAGMALALLASVCAAEVPAAQQVPLNIDAPKLARALIQLTEQTGLQLIYPAGDKVVDLPARPLIGNYTPQAALDRLLKGSGLKYEFLDERTVAIVDPSVKAKVGVSSISTRGEPAAGRLSPVTTPGGAAQGALRFARAGGQSEEAKSAQIPARAAESNSKVEEIIVTATKRAQRIQDVPMSITAITADDIDRRGLVNAGDYLRGVPGANQVEASYGGQAIIIRGLETNTIGQSYRGGSTTATYFGEAPTTNSAGLLASNVDIKLVDIERVEVLRGPQGTAFGNSSMGGAVRTIPVAPKLEGFEGRLAAGYSVTGGTGDPNDTFQAVVNLPLISGRLALRAVAYQFSDSGYYRNRAGSDPAFQAGFVAANGLQAFATDEDHVGAYRVTGGRISALLQATDKLRFTLTYLTQKNETDGWQGSTSGTYEQLLPRVAPEYVRRGQTGGLYDSRVDIANAVGEYDLGWADLLATFSHIKGGTEYAFPYTVFFPTWAASALRIDPHRENSGEVRLATKLGGAWEALAGLYADKHYDSDTSDAVWHGDPATNFFAPGQRFLSDYFEQRDLKQKAAFGEVSWKFLPRFTLTAGARFYKYERKFQVDATGPLNGAAPIHTRGDNDESGSTFRANLSYKITEDALAYAGWAQGFRVGRPQSGVPAGLCDLDNDGVLDGSGITIESTRKVDSDSVDSYEVGGKFAAFDRRLTIEAAAFRMEWTGMPVTVLTNVFSPTCVSSFITNAGEALSQGVELQMSFPATDTLRVDFGGSYIDAHLTTDVPAQGFKAGDPLPGAPKLNANVGVQQDFHIAGHPAFVRSDAIYLGSFYGDVQQSPFTKAGEYVKVDATARVRINNFNVDLYIRNLTNEDAYVFRGAYSYTGADWGYQMRPRTIGMQLAFDF